jgi:GNAT superfamily N-acetyltransferase
MNNEASRNIRIEPAAADLIARVWRERWGGELMVTPELVYGPAELEGAAVYSGNELVALVTWRWEPAGAEITSLDAFVPRRGFGSVAMDHAERVIREAGGRHARLFTTNPNIGAITMYLRRGYRVMRVHLDAMDRVRALKPGVPAEEDGLPLRDMWEFWKSLA